MRYLTSTMIALMNSGVSPYATWVHFFDKGDGSKSAYIVEAFLTYWLS